MLCPKKFLDELDQLVSFYCGVPDSNLKEFCALLQDSKLPSEHVITANEGSAVALAAGAYLAKKKPALVYLQNSGLGNIVNPVLSLINKGVYCIPVLFVIGWRGEPGVKDEPQHVVQGKVTLDMLESLGIASRVIGPDDDITPILKEAKTYLEQSLPFAILVKTNSFLPHKKSASSSQVGPKFIREEAIDAVISAATDKALIVSTTGKTSRELFELRAAKGESHKYDFLTVGSMGHTSQIAAGVALNAPDKKVICLDGDGSAIMHLGGLLTNATLELNNLIYILLNNGCHDSVGGQPTAGKDISFAEVATAFGYKHVSQCNSLEQLQSSVAEALQADVPSFIEVLIVKGSRADLGRPTIAPQECKHNFMHSLIDE